MAPISGSHARAAWLAAGMALLVLAAFTSRVAPLVIAWDFGGLSPLDAIEILAYVALFVGIALAPAAIWFGRQRRRAAARMPARSASSGLPRWASSLGLVVVLLVYAGQAAILVAFLAELQRSGRSPLDALFASELLAGDERPIGAARGLEALTIALLITAFLAVVVVVLLIAWRREQGSSDTAAVERPQAAAEAVELGLDALRREPDPRRAVIAAYAAMGRSLARSGLPREQSEAPLEYLRRILTGSAGVAKEVATLTHLFQLAKFSHHAVDDEMRGLAIGALERLRRRTEPRA